LYKPSLREKPLSSHLSVHDVDFGYLLLDIENGIESVYDCDSHDLFLRG
jgi:hypothetical protein